MYLQTSTFQSTLSKDDRRCIQHQSQHYCIIGDILYRIGVDTILHQCSTLDEAERFLNAYHSSACGGHLFGYATAQKILHARYFWPSIFKDCILVVHKCHECQIYQQKMRTPPAHLHPVITIGPFAKWGLDFMTCNPHSTGGMVILLMS